MKIIRYPFPEGLAKLYDFTEPLIKAAIPADGNVLDIGCGDGTVARFMLQEGASRVVAFDISDKAIKIAKSNNPGPEYKVGDAEDSRFMKGLGRFDLVLARNTFHHFVDKERFLRAAPDLLNYGGTFLLIDLDYESNFAFFGALATHARFALTHLPLDSFRLLSRTRIFLGRSMREHRLRDRQLLTRQGWFKARDVERNLRQELPGAKYFRCGSLLGYGGAYVASLIKAGEIA